jgi:hypothetical protein
MRRALPLASLLLVVTYGASARAADKVALAEVLASFQGDPNVAFVELAMTADGQQDIAGAELSIDVASGDPARQRVFTFPSNVTRGGAGTRILIATNRLATVASLTPDFVLPDGTLPVDGGRICYRLSGNTIDCLAYGTFAGDNGAFGKPTPLTPDDRSLERIAVTGVNRSDWAGQLQPNPQNDAGAGATLPTLCGDGKLSQGEQCDGTALGGQTCADLGFSKGKLACAQCHFDTSHCTYCGNGVIDRGETCDGTAFGDRTCASLGFTGGDLTCSPTCKLSTASCDPTFFVPGGGPRAPECLAAWRIANAAARPAADGKAPVRQRCKNGDPGCDADTSPATCTFTIAVCLDRNDARLRRGTTDCQRPPIASWTILHPRTETGGTDAALATTLLTAVEALGASTVTADTVTFTSALDPTERCTAPIPIVVPVRTTTVLRSATAGAGGHPRDVDALKLVCAP